MDFSPSATNFPNAGRGLALGILFGKVGGYDDSFPMAHDYHFWSRAVTPISCARRRMVAAGMPVMPSAHSGV